MSNIKNYLNLRCKKSNTCVRKLEKHNILCYLGVIRMKCPFCSSSNTRVIDKRKDEDLGANKRRRECLKCGRRFTTFEKVEIEDMVVVKKDGRREPFSKEKMKKSIYRLIKKDLCGF